MHPILSDLRKLISYLVAWLLVGMLIAKFLALTGLASWSTALLFSLPVVVIYGFVASSAYYVCRSLPMTGRRLIPTVVLFCGASLFSGGIWLTLCLGWNNLATSLDWWSITFTPNSVSLLFSAGCGCYLISLLLHDGLIALDNIRNAELSAAKSRVLAREAELHMLRAQINPHFLFNSLNSISALTSIDTVAARAMTIALAQFFRQSLALSEQTTIALAKEIALCDSFLEVEKIRFGSKLQSEFNIEDQAQIALLPPMLLQPLIENAIKHGIRDLSDGGVIRLTGLVRDNWLHISIENPCDETPSSTIGNGLGLKNIKQRLMNVYGNQASIQWNKTDTSFSVEITLPLQLS
ncbi:sensor histidine kinase [Solimicrobium silvestre]|uniref:Histidine kinase n=1 Tax=Solimicrobium silvestre TaxID=2099400 RepID=A0A2S9H4X3_9BURK|nr:histidine kinase [Solimicrobium silvestre]PRC95034.1 Histidine kinase [Solimicrobium silvestre]